MGMDSGDGHPGKQFRFGVISTVGILVLVLLAALSQSGSEPGNLRVALAQDVAPSLVSSFPADGATGVPLDVVPTLTFSEPVALDPLAIQLTCAASGSHNLTMADGPVTYRLLTTTPFSPNELCTVAVIAEHVRDRDTDDPPDLMNLDRTVSFSLVPPLIEDVIINELDAVTADGRNEFIELYDGGAGNTDLTGLVLVMFNGANDTSHLRINLAGYATDSDGYFLLANGDLPADLRMADDVLRDGPDAIALYAGSFNDFPFGTPVTTSNLIDAIAYDSGQPDDAGLLPLLESGQPQVNEAERGQPNLDSSQRCPNGTGGQRRTDGYLQNAPTPGTINNCRIDQAPGVVSVQPDRNAVDVLPEATIEVMFSEPVDLAQDFFRLICAGESIPYQSSGGPTAFTIVPSSPLPEGAECNATLFHLGVTDKDTLDPPDFMSQDFPWSFTVRPALAREVLINELDTDTQGADTAEFIELYDGGNGDTDLSGLTLVLYNGGSDSTYRAVDLTGQRTDSDGYLVIGSASVNADLVMPAAWLQNGTDAAALYASPAIGFPSGSPVTDDNLLDAVVYTGDGPPSAALLSLLLGGDAPVDEAAGGQVETDSSQRCPDGAGGARRTGGYGVGPPTPAAANECREVAPDEPPVVSTVLPAAGATGVGRLPTLTVTFSEPVTAASGWLRLNCDKGGSHTVTTAGGPLVYTATPTAELAPDTSCTATVLRRKVTDSDSQDPPDEMGANYVWSFRTAPDQPPAFAIISEIDTDTPASDTAEFIELFDGGAGSTALDGLTLVLFNGSTDASYAAVSLDGKATDANGYFVAGNAAVAGVELVLPDGLLQNGPDAVALYAAPISRFPNGTPMTTIDLRDAIVYGPPDDIATGLLPLLLSGQAQANEAAGQNRAGHSLQRCPDDAPPRRTDAMRATSPTPGAANACVADLAPSVVTVLPVPGAKEVATGTVLTVTFSEPVTTNESTFALTCTQAGTIPLTITRPAPDRAQLQPQQTLEPGENCSATVRASHVRDADSDDPPDTMAADFSWTFTTAFTADRAILINELDADTPGTDDAEFVELYDGGRGDRSLNGLVLVFYNGADDRSYRAIDLSGYATDKAGYFVVGSRGLAAAAIELSPGAIQNGADAVVLYAGTADDFPNGTSLRLENIIDALVYDTNDDDDTELLALLHSEQPQVNEGDRGDKDAHSNQRCPDGAGGPRQTQTFAQSAPTPGEANECVLDSAPAVLQTMPADGDAGVPLDAVLTVTFSEPVNAVSPWLKLTCGQSGDHALTVTGGSASYRLVPDRGFAGGERCQATVRATAIADSDSDDPPDQPEGDYTWAFTTAAAVCGQPTLPIAAIQGQGPASPLVGTEVTVEAIVVGTVQDDDFLYALQTPATLMDSDPTTSEALFAVTPSGAAALSTGDLVRLSGVVDEPNGRTTLVDTTLQAVCDASISVDAQPVTLPGTNEPDAWEQLEGMLVSVDGPLTVVDNGRLGSDGKVTLSVNGRLPYPTQTLPPGTAAWAAVAEAQAQQIILDDGLLNLPATWSVLSSNSTVRAGDWLSEVTGVVDPHDSTLTMHTPTSPLFQAANPRPAPPAPTGDLRLLSLNTDGLLLPTSGYTTGFVRQRDKFVATIVVAEADIVSLLQLGGDSSQRNATIGDLLAELNNAVPGANFSAIQAGAVISGASPAAVFLYRTGAVAATGTPSLLSDTLLANHTVAPVAQRFQLVASGDTLLVVAASYPDRATCPAASGPDSDQADGQGCNNAQRASLSAGLNAWLTSDAAVLSSDRIVLLGELQALLREDPVQTLLDAGWLDLQSDDPPAGRYSAMLDGLHGQTHFAFGSPALAAGTERVTLWHSNADEPAAFGPDTTEPPGLYAPDPYRSSASDPLLVDLRFVQEPAAFASNSPVTIGATAVFTATSPTGDDLDYRWDLGDGSAERSGSTITHLYSRPGIFNVTLTVAYAGNEQTVSQPFVVLPHRVYLPVSLSSLSMLNMRTNDDGYTAPWRSGRR